MLRADGRSHHFFCCVVLFIQDYVRVHRNPPVLLVSLALCVHTAEL